MKIFPTLYKKTNTLAIQCWRVWTEQKVTRDGQPGYYVVTEFGQKDTDSPQVTKDLITSGKNIGKKNETSIQEQANLEAEYKWEKKKKKGYVEKLDDAQKGKVDKTTILGGIEPMLAHVYEKHATKIKFPCYAQPKLDGHRCVAIIKMGRCTLWTRTRKEITSCPHIISELEKRFPRPNILVLDGELYNHDFKDNFEYISHLVRQEVPDTKHTDIQYHIYDLISVEKFEQRFQFLKKEIIDLKYCKMVQTSRIVTQVGVKSYFNTCLSKGYEGIMLRNADSLYVNKRSYDLQKVKTFLDEEFEIIGIKEGKGKLRGHVGAFQCQQKDGSQFDAKMSGEMGKLKEYFENHSLWQGKKLTVQFQGRSTYNIPRFPVGLRIRDNI